MRRTHHVLNWLAGGLLGAIGLITPPTAPAQETPPVTPPAAARSRANAFVVAINSTKRLSMTSKRPIRSVVNEKDSIARIQAIQDDPSSVLVVGLQAGSTRVTMTDDQGTVEAIDIVVELDIDAIRSVLRRAFPTAAVEPIPTGTNTILLVGNVAHAEEIEAILRVAQGVLVSGVPGGPGGSPNGQAGGTITVVNGMTVGGVRQVQLDVVIAQVNRSKLREFGVNWATSGTTAFGGSLIGNLTQAGTSAGGGGSTGGTTGGGTSTTLLGPQSLLTALTPGSNTNIVFGLVPARLNVFIQALKQEQMASLLAEPKLVTMSGRPATFLSGGQQAVPEVTGGGTSGGVVGTRFEPFGTQLTFLPIVRGDGKIYLEVEPVVSVLNAANGFSTGGVIVQGRNEQRVRTSVLMEPGQTFAIGGLIQTEKNGANNKTPILGELPFIGPAFSTVSYTESETELVVLVTPYLVDSMDCRQAPCKLPGLETRTPDDFELFLELILEAPRGQREVFPGNKYKAAWTNDPSAARYPCGGGNCANGSCGNPAGGCATCGQSAVTPAAAPVTASAPPPPPPAVAPATHLPPSVPVVPAATATQADPPDIVPSVAIPARQEPMPEVRLTGGP
jgi:pilus assembly protein CpaC